jgi:hypothetical protein
VGETAEEVAPARQKTGKNAAEGAVKRIGELN